MVTPSAHGYFVDSMLLVLLVVGRANRQIVERHRNLEMFSIDDFDVLAETITEAGGVVSVTPNTLTEASNLLGQHRSPEKELLFDTLASLIHESQEVLVSSADATEHQRFRDLGLADAVLLQQLSAERPLLTTDGRLYAFALSENAEAAFNFNHRRDSETQR